MAEWSQALETLGERERMVIEARLSGLTLRETGERVGGMSGRPVGKERIRQIETKALRKLRRHLEDEQMPPLGDYS